MDGRERVEEATLTEWGAVVVGRVRRALYSIWARSQHVPCATDRMRRDRGWCRCRFGAALVRAGRVSGRRMRRHRGVDSALIEGEIAALAIAGDRMTGDRSLAGSRDRFRDRARRMEAAFALRSELRRIATPGTIVCRCEDVRLGELRPDWTSRQAKLYVRAGNGCVPGPRVRARPPVSPRLGAGHSSRAARASDDCNAPGGSDRDVRELRRDLSVRSRRIPRPDV